MTAAEAQKYLEIIQTLPADHIGPMLNVRPPIPDLTLATQLSTCLNQAVVRVDETTYRAPSPWHAAAWLLDAARMIAQLGLSNRATGMESPLPPNHGAPVFRGQRDSGWTLVPTLLREPRDESCAVALELFIEAQTELFRLVADDTRMNGRYVHMAAAQHYGMKTPLLDFTVDPRIAVWFAAAPGSDGSTEAVVYGMSFRTACELGGAVVFPPPWVNRLYSQRGLFVDCTGLQPGVDLRQRSLRILFPPDQAYREWLFPEASNAILSPEPWYDKSIKWARQAADKGDPPCGSGRCGAALKEMCGMPDFYFNALHPDTWRSSLAGFVDMCEWLALKFCEGQFRYDLNTVELLWARNEPIFRSHSVLVKFLRQYLGRDSDVMNQNRMLAALAAVEAARPRTQHQQSATVGMQEGTAAATLPPPSKQDAPSPMSEDPRIRQLQQEAATMLAEALAVSGLTFAEIVELNGRMQLGSDNAPELQVAPYELTRDGSASIDPGTGHSVRAATLFFEVGRRLSRVQEFGLAEFDRARVCLHAAWYFCRMASGPEIREIELRAVGAICYLHLTMADCIVDEKMKPLHEEMAARYAELEGFLCHRLGDRAGAASAYSTAQFRYARAGRSTEAARAAKKAAECRG